ncbi:MAG: TspO/MBR family protein [Minisyncoccia bacterium]
MRNIFSPRWRGHAVQPSVLIRKLFQLLLFILIAQAVGIFGTYFTFDAIPTWYAELVKPSFSPPNWVFGPVWTILYAMMGIAAFCAWELWYEKTHAPRALNWYWLQLFLNGIWTLIFFGFKNLGLALIVILALFLAILMMIREFGKIDMRLALLLVPYLLWVMFASTLNYSLWMLN